MCVTSGEFKLLVDTVNTHNQEDVKVHNQLWKKLDAVDGKVNKINEQINNGISDAAKIIPDIQKDVNELKITIEAKREGRKIAIYVATILGTAITAVIATLTFIVNK